MPNPTATDVPMSTPDDPHATVSPTAQGMSMVMTTDGQRVLAGLAAVIVGAIQVSSLVIRIASVSGSLTIIRTLQLLVCGSLLVTGILTLVSFHHDHHRDRP